MRPATYDPLLDIIPEDRFREILVSLAGATGAVVEAAPSHDSYFNAGTAATGGDSAVS